MKLLFVLTLVAGLIVPIASNAHGSWVGGYHHGGGWYGGGWNGWGGSGIIINTGGGYYSNPYPTQCEWVGGHRNRYGYWIPAHQICWNY